MIAMTDCLRQDEGRGKVACQLDNFRGASQVSEQSGKSIMIIALIRTRINLRAT